LTEDRRMAVACPNSSVPSPSTLRRRVRLLPADDSLSCPRGWFPFSRSDPLPRLDAEADLTVAGFIDWVPEARARAQAQAGPSMEAARESAAFADPDRWAKQTGRPRTRPAREHPSARRPAFGLRPARERPSARRTAG